MNKTFTLEELKNNYPNSMSANDNNLLVEAWKDSLPEDKLYTFGDNEKEVSEDYKESFTDEAYPQCNYCVGGALQMAFGVKEPSTIDNWQEGIFPSTSELAETLHYFCDIPYANTYSRFEFSEYHCSLKKHRDNLVHNEVEDEWIMSEICQREANYCREKCITTDDTKQTAYDLAHEIIDANDNDKIEAAWNYVQTVIDLYSEQKELKLQ